MAIDKNQFETQEVTQPETNGRKTKDDIVDQLWNTVTKYQDTRHERENKWLEAWAHYFSTPESRNFLQSRAFHSVGDVQTDWRHRVPDGKAFEMVESVTSFMMGAFFPNKNWFNVKPQKPLGLEPEDYRKYIRLLKAFFKTKLKNSNFEDAWEEMTRQAVAIGTSVIALPWRYQTEPKNVNVKVPQEDGSHRVETKTEDKTVKNGFEFEVLSMFDVFLEPHTASPNEGNMFRRYRRTRAQLMSEFDAGKHPLTTKKTIQELDGDTRPRDHSGTNEKDRQEFLGEESEIPKTPEDMITIWEFWGDITVNGTQYKNVMAVFSEHELLQFQTIPFWGGKPFIAMNFIPVLNSPYGIGVLDPVLGDLHAKMLARNQRLDIIEFSINPMFEVVNDGTLDLNNLHSEPGKVVPVAETNSIRQISQVADVGTSVQEEQLMEQSIEKVTGTGAFIGSGATRNAERVTAQEIEATRSAGGNRLNGVHRHMERQGLLAFLRKAFRTIQQFVTEDELVPVSVENDPQTTEFIEIGVNELNQDIDLEPLGADFVADEEFELRQRTDFLQLAGNSEQLSQTLNWTEIAKDLARRFLKEDWEDYIVEPEEQGLQGQPPLTQGQEPVPPPSELEQLKEGARQTAGEPAELAIEQTARAGQTEEALSRISQRLQSSK